MSLTNWSHSADPLPSHRKSWQESKVQGTPDRPPPFSLRRAYPKLDFRAPVSIHRIPANGKSQPPRLAVIEQAGKIKSFVDRDDVEQADLMIDVASPTPRHADHIASKKFEVDCFSMAFHPKFAENRFVYVCYIVKGANPNGTHISRYQMTDSNPPTMDFESETTIIRFDGGGHNGCTLEFGPDGYLYISIGDLKDPTPPDPLKTGQDISDLYSSILRIDVDRPSQSMDGRELAYTIPADNPFVKLPNARGEVYAFGLRNPWRMSFDSKTGELWVGDVGWEAYEMVYRVRSGGNYGWSLKEGPGDAQPNQPLGPTPILAPDITLTHADAASVTGGVVHRGSQLPTLRGKYVFGDWITRRFWAAEFDATTILSLQEIASGEVKPICFGTDSQGELLVLEYIQWNQAGGIYRFVPNPAAATFEEEAFPRKLSQTGVFRDTKTLAPNDGVFPYRLNSTMWMDGAQAEFHLAVPGDAQVQIFQSPQPTFDWFKSKVLFPKDTVLVKTYSIEANGVARKIESQIGHYGGVNDWRYYTYRWLDDQSDAVLVSADGESAFIKTGTTPDQELKWTFAARSQCKICHTPWTGNATGFIQEQLRRPLDSTDAWRDLIQQGFLSLPEKNSPRSDSDFTAMAYRTDPHASLGARARSYLHSNCAHCHQFGGNGAAAFDVRFEKPLAESKLVDAIPLKGNMQLDDAKLIAPGDPLKSVLYYRTAKSGGGRMPHIGSEVVDVEGVKLLHQWIVNMPRDEKQRNALAKLTSPNQSTSKGERLSAANELLTSASGAMLIANAFSEHAVPEFIKAEVLTLANQASEAVRDVLEPWMPQEQRVVRLGSNFDKRQLLDLKGDSARGKQLVLSGAGQCIQCHKIDNQGKEVGPSLGKVATKYTTSDAMLEQLLNPSATIAPEYRSILILTSDNETIIGSVAKRTDTVLSLLLADGSPRDIHVSDIEAERENAISLMPEGLLAPLTPQQASDLLAYLGSLKSE